MKTWYTTVLRCQNKLIIKRLDNFLLSLRIRLVVYKKEIKMKFFKSYKIALLVMFCFGLSSMICKIGNRIRTRERTLFGMLNDPVGEGVLNQTMYPPFNEKTCTNKTEEANKTAEFHVNITITNITQPLVIIPTATPQCNADWNYQQHGGDWECICAEGNEQSPIDLPSKESATLAPIRPVLNYEVVSPEDDAETLDRINSTPSDKGVDNSVKIRYHNGVIKIITNTIGKLVKLDGSVYSAEEIQFHTPSEHTIAGERFDMEMQVIHYGVTQGDIAKQAVLSFLFKKTPGKYNKFIDSLDFYSLPNPTDSFRELYNEIYIPNVLYSSDEDQIPVLKPFSFYTYEGSLTFPPCTERTTHYVVADPIELSSTAISLFREALRKPDRMDERGNLIVDSSPLAENYRDTQPLNKREVFIYDHKKYDCPTFEKKSLHVEPKGHYEKKIKEATQYIFVDGDQPSGIPGAYVVSEEEAKGAENKSK